jgi:hypothetical protein
LRVAVVSTAKYFMPHLIGSFCTKHPAIDVSLEILNRDGVVHRLRENLDDLYIMSMPPKDMDLGDEAFMPNPIVLIAPNADPLAKRTQVGLHELAHGAAILAVRVWPAKDYTRVTIESDNALSTQTQFVANPPRLAVDIEGIELNPALRELVGKVRSDDPYITGVRVGQFTPSTVRLVLDLRQPVKPQVFNLEPVQSGQANIQHRLVLDLYPLTVSDPLEALIAEKLRDDNKPPADKDALGEWMNKHSNAPAQTAATSLHYWSKGNPDTAGRTRGLPSPTGDCSASAHRLRHIWKGRIPWGIGRRTWGQ